MKKEGKNIILKILGIFYILLGIAAIYSTVTQHQTTETIFWTCYIALPLIGIGMLTKRAELIAAQMNILAIPLLIWTIDFLKLITTGQSFWGLTNYVLDMGFTFSNVITLQHLFTLPLSILAIYLIKLKHKDFWKVSAIQVIALFILSRFIATAEHNVNCAYKACMTLPFTISTVFYPFLWFATAAALITITHLILVNLKFLNKK